MTELDKLEKYLKEKKITFDRIDQSYSKKAELLKLGYPVPDGFGEQHQIIVYDEKGNREWDAICHYGSYGFEKGLLEIMGTIVNVNSGDSVEGWLTAEDIIKRLDGNAGSGKMK